MKISASIYSTDRKLEEVVSDLDAHRIDFFHVDCNDDPAVFKDIETIRKHSRTPVDLHLITSEPEKYYSLLISHPVEFLTFQFENLIGELNVPDQVSARLGLAITADTDLEVFDKFAERFDFILMMATIPGKSGGSFNKEIFRKIRMFRKKYPGKKVHVDGGVNAEVSFILRNMGVYASVSGSYLFNAASLGHALLNLKTHENESQFQVKDFMMDISETPCLKPGNRSFRDILQSIDEYQVGYTSLIDEDGKLEGIISNADVRKGLIRNIDALDNIRWEDLINTKPLCVEENNTVADLIRLIKSSKFPVSYLPVVDHGNKIKGTLTFFNLIKGEA